MNAVVANKGQHMQPIESILKGNISQIIADGRNQVSQSSFDRFL